MDKRVHIIGGGTVSHIRTHLALCSPAHGGTAKRLFHLFDEARRQERSSLRPVIHLTNMAGGHGLETNEDVTALLGCLAAKSETKVIILTAALCDYEAQIGGVPGNRHGRRLQSRDGDVSVILTPAAKIVGNIRSRRKDIFAVAFKVTDGYTADDQYAAGLNLLKESSVNLVLANDVVTGLNMIITPEEARYHQTTNRDEALAALVDMTLLRSQLTFTRSTVVAGEPVSWFSPSVPASLRTVVNHCIRAGAYKPFRGATVGHFACKIGDNVFLTSIRKSNFNELAETGLVRVVTDGPDSVMAYGAKPSVGGQSQRIIFSEHPDYDCVIHFHCPKRRGSAVPEVSQREYECGSHQCGQNTSRGLRRFGNLSAVYLQEHGPNVVFHSSVDPQEVINFIDTNFDLQGKTGGLLPVQASDHNNNR